MRSANSPGRQDDLFSFNGIVPQYTWECLGEQKILGPMNTKVLAYPYDKDHNFGPYGLSFADDRFELAGFIRNAFDEDYLLDAGNTGGAFTVPTFIPAEPRLFGIELTARIGR